MKYLNKYLVIGFLIQISFGEAASIFLIDARSSIPLKNCTIHIFLGKTSLTSDEDGKIDILFDQEITLPKTLEIQIISGEFSGFTTLVDPSLEEQVVMVSKPSPKNQQSPTSSKKVKSLKEFSIHKENVFADQLLSKNEIKNSFQVNFNDVVKALQTKAGVSFSGRESTSTLYVQGSPSRNATFLYDEIEISTSSSRLGESASMFNPLLMEKVQLHKAGYSTRLLGGTSGVVALSSLNCDFQKWNVFFGVDNSIELLVNGPLYKDKVAGFVHFRRTLLEVFTKLDSNEERKSQLATLPNILDVNTKISAKIKKNGTMNFLANFSMESVATKDLKKSSKLFEQSNSLEDVEAKFDHQAWFGIWTINYQHSFSPFTSILGAIGQTPTVSDTSRIAINKKTQKVEKTDGVESFRSSSSSYITQLVINAEHKISLNQSVDGGIRIHLLPKNFEFTSHFNHFGLLPTPNQGKYLTTSAQRHLKEIGFLISPHIHHSWSPLHNLYISEGMRLHWYSSDNPWPISGSGHIHVEYRKIPLFRIYQHIGVYSQHVVSSYGKILNITDQSTNPEHSAHLIWGAQTLLKYFLVHAEPFFKYNWNTLFSRNDVGLDNSGKSYHTGVSVGMLQIPSPEDFIHLSLGYMFVFSREVVTFRKESLTDNFYQYKTHLDSPKVGTWGVPSHVRDHSLSVNIKATPFIRFTQLQNVPHWTKNSFFAKQSFNLQFIFLSGSPYTPGKSVIKRSDVDWPNPFTYQIVPGEYNSQKTPNIYKLDMKYSIPLQKKSEIFISFLNLLNLKNDYLNSDIVSKTIKDPSVPPGTYEKNSLETFGQSSIDSGFGRSYFSLRFGINIWLEIQHKTVKLS